MNAYRITKFDKLGSTSKYMKENLDKLSVFDVVTADVQTSGYGRMQREWYDNTDNLSFSLYIELPIQEANGILTQVSALAVTDVLMKYMNNVSIKWPNDCLVNGKKISGILIENIVQGSSLKMIVGIGVNVNNREFNDSIQNKATSLFLETKKEFDKNDLLQEILKRFDYYYEMFIYNDFSFMKTIRERSSLIGKEVTLFEGMNVIVKNIDEYGRLLIDDNGKEKIYTGSEVTLTRNY